MKKIRIFAAVALVVMLCCVLAVSASAKWWDDNPFTDVKSSSWYYDAVRICNENGLFKGTTETTFGTSIGMDRAMLVTVLAAGDESFDADKYTTSSFSDIRDGSWYMTAVEWANEKGIASGIADGAFGPKNTVTRQELALMLMKYAEYKGMDITVSEETDISSYPDANTVSSWATDAVKWAVQNGLISGTAQGDKVMLSPKGTATRATVAQIMVKFLALEPVYTINGNDLSLYKIVYGANVEGSEGPTSESAEDLADAIKESLGIELEVVSDETGVYDYEILVGKTNREDAGLVNVDRASFEDDQTYIWSVQGNYLVICGIDSTYDNNTATDKSHRNVAGTRNAVYFFAREVLGIDRYSDVLGGEISVCAPDPVIALEDGYSYSDMVWYRTRTFYMGGSVNGCGNYANELPNSMSGWLHNEDGHGHDDTPCLTDENNIQTIIANILKAVEDDPSATAVYVGINDSQEYCKCENCYALYREHGARSATVALLANRVSDALTEKYPDMEVCLGAYEYTQKPPKNIQLRDNIYIEFVTVKNCSGHSYSDTGCTLNKSIATNISGWDEISSGGMTAWDHTGGFAYFMTPQPDWDSLLENVRFFADRGARGILINSVFYGEELPNGKGPETHSDLGSIRAYMLSMIYMDPYMSKEEFDYRLNNCLKANYGPGWANVREYIDTIAELGNSRDHNFHAPPSGHYIYEEVAEKADRLNTLWANAIAMAETEEQVNRLKIHETSWIYLYQCATYESRYANGTAQQRAEYEELNEYLYNCILDMRLHWTEGTLNPLDNYSVANSPEKW